MEPGSRSNRLALNPSRCCCLFAFGPFPPNRPQTLPLPPVVTAGPRRLRALGTICSSTSIYPVGRKLRPSHLIGLNRGLSRRKSIYLTIADLLSPSLRRPRPHSFGLNLRLAEAGSRVSLFLPFLPVCSSFRSGTSWTHDRLAGLNYRSSAPQPIHFFNAVKPAQFLRGLEEK